MSVRLKKCLSILLCVLMLVQYVPATALAVTDDNLCEHHAEHTAECGYVEGAGGCSYQCDLCLEQDHAEEPTEAAEPAPVCDCGTDDESIHATNCAVYVAPENPVCTCAEKCVEPNVWCDVCGLDAAAYADVELSTIDIEGVTYYQIGSADELYAFVALVNGGGSRGGTTGYSISPPGRWHIC